MGAEPERLSIAAGGALPEWVCEEFAAPRGQHASRRPVIRPTPVRTAGGMADVVADLEAALESRSRRLREDLM